MKSILLSICLLACFAPDIHAQSSTGTVRGTISTPEQQNFGSKINLLEAGVVRGNKQMAQSSANDLMQMMQSHIAQNIKLMNEATDDKTKADLNEKVKTENKLAADFKVMSADLDKNQKELVAKARAFGDIF